MLAPDIEEVCQSFGVEIAEFLPRIPDEFCKAAAIYVSGSLIEGFGNATSDLDVMIVSHLPLDDVPCTIRKDFAAIDMIAGRTRRIDLEYVNNSWFERPLAVIRELDIPVDFVAERIDEREELLIHRLIKSKPVYNGPAYRSLRDTVPEDVFRRYMIKRCLHKIDGATLDLEGLLKKQDVPDVLMRLYDVIDFAADAVRFHYGLTNPLPKWRIRSLTNIAETHPGSIAAEILNFYLEHRVFKRHKPDLNIAQTADYVRDCLYWVDQKMRRVYG